MAEDTNRYEYVAYDRTNNLLHEKPIGDGKKLPIARVRIPRKYR